jgi:hypothetical protein
MGFFAKLLVDFVAWLATVFALSFSRKVALMIAVTVAFVGLLTTLSLAVKGAVSAITATLPPSVAMGVGMMVPTNFPVVLAAMFTCWFAASIYILGRDYLKLWASITA